MWFRSMFNLKHTGENFKIFSTGSSDGKESACNTGDLDLIPELGRSPGEGNSYPLWYSRLENPMNRRAWWAVVHGVTKSLSGVSH